MAVGQGWAGDGQEIFTLAGASAERAILLDPMDARALAIAGHVKAYLFHDVKAALSLHERAVGLNPNLPIAWTLSAWSKTYSGDHATAIRHAQMAHSLSPRDPHAFFVDHATMMAHLFRRELAEADALAEAVLERKPNHASALRSRMAILGHLGRQSEAADHFEKLLQIEPGATIATLVARPPFQPEDLAYYAEGLRKAGLPE
jgi:tetratricopeptide (TPR) repeat protein